MSNFPPNPYVNQSVEINGRTYTFNGLGWTIEISGGGGTGDNNIDGGAAASVYVPGSGIDGGNA